MPATDRAPGTVLGLVVASVLAAAVGVFVGTVTTFVHRQWQLHLGPVTVPWGLIAGVAIVACVVAGFRLAFESRIVASAAAVGILGACALLALPGPGGSVVVLDEWLGWLWAVLPTLVSVIVLAWPRVARRPSSPSGVAALSGDAGASE